MADLLGQWAIDWCPLPGQLIRCDTSVILTYFQRRCHFLLIVQQRERCRPDTSRLRLCHEFSWWLAAIFLWIVRPFLLILLQKWLIVQWQIEWDFFFSIISHLTWCWPCNSGFIERRRQHKRRRLLSTSLLTRTSTGTCVSGRCFFFYYLILEIFIWHPLLALFYSPLVPFIGPSDDFCIDFFQPDVASCVYFQFIFRFQLNSIWIDCFIRDALKD